MLTHLDLFSGIGGFALACQWAGIETIGFVEIDKYCQKVLRKHWPDVPIVEDIRDVARIKEIAANATSQGCLAKQYEAGIPSQALRKTPTGQPSRTDSMAGIGTRATATCESPTPTILVTAGFPCQPFSVAGRRQGEADDRYLWPQTFAVIKTINPRWILLENVTGIIPMALDTVLSDLERQGYSRETLVIPACAVNAWHRRDRVWIVAHCENKGLERWEGFDEWQKHRQSRCALGHEPRPICQDVANSTQLRQQGDRRLATWERMGQEQEGTHIEQGGWWAPEPNVGRMANGVPDRVDRIRTLGNAIVPQVAYEIIKAIVEIDKLIPHYTVDRRRG